MLFERTALPKAEGNELDVLLERWEKQYRYGTVEDRSAREARWEPYYSMVYASQLDQPFHIPDEPEPAVRVLLDEKLLTPGTSVLEIGCGTGLLALSLSRYCKSVTAMDANKTAIKVLNTRCAKERIDNITAVRASWNEKSDAGHYDLVISSMCPAVCNKEAIEAMEAAGDLCALITVMRGSYDKYRRMIMQELELKPEGMITEYGTYLDVLRAMGRKPSLWTRSVRSEHTTDLSALLRTFPVYLEIFGVDRQRSELYLKDFFERNQSGGVLHDETLMNTAMIVWQRERC